ncbi:Germ cell-less protein-like 1 [Sparganum proliferum]
MSGCNFDTVTLAKRIRSTYEYVYRELFCKGEGSDIIVSALGYEWLLHRIYIKQSPFFAAMLDGGWKESDCNRIELELSDPAITKHALDVVFGSFYCDCVSLTDQTVLNILAAATWFHLEDIRQSCNDFLKREIRLDTVIEFHAVSGKYSLPELNQACVDWLAQKLLVIPDSPALFTLLQNIPTSLMQTVVSHPRLVVIQLEQDVFICLLKWMYLQHNPDMQYCPASDLLKQAYEYYTTVKPNFLASPEGAPYAAAFRGVRWEHVVTIYKATHRMIQDRIVPEGTSSDACFVIMFSASCILMGLDLAPAKNWLAAAFQRQWLQILSTHESQSSLRDPSVTAHVVPPSSSTTAAVNGQASNASSLLPGVNLPRVGTPTPLPDLPGPRENLPHDVFWRLSERCGRRMLSGESTCSWRWTGFHFGLDVLIKYRRRVFYVIRLTDAASSEGSVCRSREHRLMICMTVLSNDCLLSDGASDSSSDSCSESSDSNPPSPTRTPDSGEGTADVRHRPPSRAKSCTSGVLTLRLTENSLQEVLRLPEGFPFPAVVSANILRYDPISLPGEPLPCSATSSA